MGRQEQFESIAGSSSRFAGSRSPARRSPGRRTRPPSARGMPSHSSAPWIVPSSPAPPCKVRNTRSMCSATRSTIERVAGSNGCASTPGVGARPGRSRPRQERGPVRQTFRPSTRPPCRRNPSSPAPRRARPYHVLHGDGAGPTGDVHPSPSLLQLEQSEQYESPEQLPLQSAARAAFMGQNSGSRAPNVRSAVSRVRT